MPWPTLETAWTKRREEEQRQGQGRRQEGLLNQGIEATGLANPTGKNGSERKPWTDAIRRALARREQTGSANDLNRLAETLIDKAAEGDMSALKELGDRLDGKPSQPIGGASDLPPLILEKVERIIIDPAAADATGVRPTAQA